MSPESSAHVEQYLREMGVNVLLNKMVTDYKDHRVVLKDGSSIATRTFIWVSGVAAQPMGNLPETSIGRGRRIKVNAFNQVLGLNDVYCIGDQCIMEEGDDNWKGGHPQLAQVAIQQGSLLAKNLKRLEKGKEMKPFKYINLGTMATVGRNRAVAEFSKIKMAGFFAWLMWLVVHLRSILGVRNKLIVLLNWMWNYFSYGQSLRLIIYAKKAKEIEEREKRLANKHWGTDLLSEGADEVKLADG
jgi:NADH dehydrogenase